MLSVPEWKAFISEMYTQLYSTVVQAGMRYFETTATITATGAASYPLPSDHDETIGIDRVIDATSNRKTQLGELQVQERNRFAGITGDAIAYAIVAQTVVLFPKPSSGAYQHVYVAQSPDISALADATTVDLVTGDGESFLIWGVAAMALPKTETDTTAAINERDAANGRFREDVQRRALINPRRRIVMPSLADDPYGDGGWLDRDPGGWWNR